ncbi:hypothetical protein J1N35_015152 [Gossypium stocksii]|uniref:Uncharacterized protein n=1 Tax=Gossypium stocksii TaxID=47602 RepID=A0A9D3VXD5_9ROSI|nr:hypothetical protein J1N35_015152 [Gossypium stocksii]
MLSSPSTEIANTNEDDILSSEEIITKKVRFKDLDVPPDDMMVVDSALVPSKMLRNPLLTVCHPLNSRKESIRSWKKKWQPPWFLKCLEEILESQPYIIGFMGFENLLSPFS